MVSACMHAAAGKKIVEILIKEVFDMETYKR